MGERFGCAGKNENFWFEYYLSIYNERFEYPELWREQMSPFFLLELSVPEFFSFICKY